MKFLWLLLILFVYSTLLFSQPNYPIITYDELQNYEYTIIEENDEYCFVEIDGVIYMLLKD